MSVTLASASMRSAKFVAKDMVVGTLLACAVAPAIRAAADVGAHVYGLSDRAMWVILMCANHLVCNLLFAMPFIVCDTFGWMQKFKMHRKKAEVPSDSLMRRLWAETALGQFVTSPIAAWVLYPLTKKLGAADIAAPLPASLWDIAVVMAAAHLFNDVGFYSTHRLLHESPFLYRTIHKKHHSWKGTVAPAAEYAHPLETIISNQFPTLGGAIFLGAHPVLLCAWVAIRLQRTYEAHSGYCLRGTPLLDFLNVLGIVDSEEAVVHDFHHTVNTGCYGSTFLDYTLGTMTSFEQGGGEDGYLRKHGHFTASSTAGGVRKAGWARSKTQNVA